MRMWGGGGFLPEIARAVVQQSLNASKKLQILVFFHSSSIPESLDYG